MNTPQQHAELYRKAAETIEMCAKHGIEPSVKVVGEIHRIKDKSFCCDVADYEFPVSVIECQLVWADTVVYNNGGYPLPAREITGIFGPYTLTPPKQPLCEVEGKPVYAGDEVYDGNGCKIIVDRYDGANIFGRHCDLTRVVWDLKLCSLLPKPKTVMVELFVEDVECIANFRMPVHGIVSACRKTLDNLKG